MPRNVMFCVAAVLLWGIGFPRLATADPVPIIRYDITGAAVSGAGLWAHVYSGSITSSGTIAGIPVANYEGGTGTLNDGVIGTSAQTSHLFVIGPNSPVITLFFDRPYSLASISLYGGNIGDNAIPGAIESAVTVTRRRDITVTPSAVAFGPGLSGIGIPVNDLLTLTGTALEGVFTDRLSLSGFHSGYTSEPLFSITEIVVEGDVAPVPEPATLLLVGVGLAGAMSRRSRKKTVLRVHA